MRRFEVGKQYLFFNLTAADPHITPVLMTCMEHHPVHKLVDPVEKGKTADGFVFRSRSGAKWLNQFPVALGDEFDERVCPPIPNGELFAQQTVRSYVHALYKQLDHLYRLTPGKASPEIDRLQDKYEDVLRGLRVVLGVEVDDLVVRRRLLCHEEIMPKDLERIRFYIRPKLAKAASGKYRPPGATIEDVEVY